MRYITVVIMMIIGISECQAATQGSSLPFTDEVSALLRVNEGVRSHPYYCTAGKLTIGVGRNLTDRGLTEDEIQYLLYNDIKECFRDLQIIFTPKEYSSFSRGTRIVLVDMRFQLGHTGFRKFKRMIKAFRNNDVEQAIIQIKGSLYYKQVKRRADRNIKLLKGKK